MRLALVLLYATGALASGKLPFDLPKGWQATLQAKTATAAAPIDDTVYELQAPEALSLRGQLVVYAGKIAEGDLEHVAAERHQARLKNRVAWGMKAQAGPPRETLKIGGRRAVRWRDRVGGALGSSEQLMTCVVHGARLACVITVQPEDALDAAEAAAATILASGKR